MKLFLSNGRQGSLAQTSSCEMSHPSVLSVTGNPNDSLFAICDTSHSLGLKPLPEASVLNDRIGLSLVLLRTSGIQLHGEQTFSVLIITPNERAGIKHTFVSHPILELPKEYFI